MIKIFAPASIGNISVGFDVLGAAIKPIDGYLLGDFITIEKSDYFSLKNTGSFGNKLPKILEQNIVYQCWKLFCEQVGKNIPVSIILEKNMPIGSGLGSSACSIVAGLLGMNEFYNQYFNKNELLVLMGQLEGSISGSIHYDNVCPCFLGGIQLILEENNIISQTIPNFKNWFWIIAYPGINISTLESRSLLPKKYLRQDCIKHSQRLAGFIHASHMRQPLLAAKLMRDIIAEPYRYKLLPDFIKVKNFVEKVEVLSWGISGAGPTIFVICDKIKIAKEVAEWLANNYIQNNDGFVHICNIDNIGARKLG